MLVTDVVAVLPQQWPGMCRSWFLLDNQLCPGEAMPCVEFAILNLRGLPGPKLSVWTNDATGSQALAPMVSGRAVVLAGVLEPAPRSWFARELPALDPNSSERGSTQLLSLARSETRWFLVLGACAVCRPVASDMHVRGKGHFSNAGARVVWTSGPTWSSVRGLGSRTYKDSLEPPLSPRVIFSHRRCHVVSLAR